ncbi:hypothetical protein [Dyadobacter sp. CY312]|uniref:FEKKY domain-containing protein n=1 Tax=Dyadobacter sp. CY312 TaxID=2907303 RepID=UPI001F2A559D|nr:hypothetical protein [Dyadobacter sp. CY312]MCE7040326.1 hypothetical protein [Dyadobacter sp. CY312]
MKKLLIINFTLLLLVIAAIIFPDVYMYGFSSSNLSYSLTREGWKILAGVILSGVVTSFLLGIPRIGMGVYLVRVLRANSLVTSLFLIFIVYHASVAVLEFQKQYESLVLEYKTKAESDIKNGMIVYEHGGGMAIPMDSSSELRYKKMDSIRAIYGVEYRNICVSWPAFEKAQSRYYAFTKPYLDKRNGIGWEERMEKQILEISNN